MIKWILTSQTPYVSLTPIAAYDATLAVTHSPKAHLQGSIGINGIENTYECY